MPIGVNLSSNTRIYRRFRSPNPLKKGAQDSSSPFFKGSQCVGRLRRLEASGVG